MIHYKIEVSWNDGLRVEPEKEHGFYGTLDYHDENIKDLREIENHLRALERYGIFKKLTTSATTDLKL